MVGTIEILDEDIYEQNVLTSIDTQFGREQQDQIEKLQKHIEELSHRIANTTSDRLLHKFILKRDALSAELDALRQHSAGDSNILDADILDAPKPGHLEQTLSKTERHVVDDAANDAYEERLVNHYAATPPNPTLKSFSVDGTPWSIPGVLSNRLFPYQREGAAWLLRRLHQGSGAILADEMGLGKTPQAIAVIAALFDARTEGNVLIIAPATLIAQWVEAIHSWYPPLRVVAFHRALHSKGCDPSLNKILRSTASTQTVFVTSYAMMLQDENLVFEPWRLVILDEGHRIRNSETAIYATLTKLNTTGRIVLTGTPIQNTLMDLWALIDWAHPGILGTQHAFGIAFETPIRLGAYAHAGILQRQTALSCATLLRDIISPVLMRRSKAQVRNQLPSKHEHVVLCPLSGPQRLLYETFLASTLAERIRQRHHNVLHGIDILRKICNAPFLLSSRDVQAIGCSEDLLHSDIPASKLEVLSSLLAEWHKENHRALLFCQTRQMLDILEKEIQKCGYTYLRMDGSTDTALRQPLVAKFNSASSIFLFLLTTRVGGLGLNLTGADRVVIYDPDWNPSTDLQARERAWRIGQQREVVIYRLITKGTIEEKIYKRQIFKTMVTNRILRDPGKLRLFKRAEIHDLFSLETASGTENPKDMAMCSATGERHDQGDDILTLLLGGQAVAENGASTAYKTEAARIAAGSLALISDKELTRKKVLAAELQSFLKSHGGKAPTDAILDHFSSRIETKEKHLFKSLLMDMAEKRQTAGGIIWCLRHG